MDTIYARDAVQRGLKVPEEMSPAKIIEAAKNMVQR